MELNRAKQIADAAGQMGAAVSGLFGNTPAAQPAETAPVMSERAEPLPSISPVIGAATTSDPGIIKKKV